MYDKKIIRTGVCLEATLVVITVSFEHTCSCNLVVQLEYISSGIVFYPWCTTSDETTLQVHRFAIKQWHFYSQHVNTVSLVFYTKLHTVKSMQSMWNNNMYAVSATAKLGHCLYHPYAVTGGTKIIISSRSMQKYRGNPQWRSRV